MAGLPRAPPAWRSDPSCGLSLPRLCSAATLQLAGCFDSPSPARERVGGASMDEAAGGVVGVGSRGGDHAAQVVAADGEMDAAAMERFAAAAGLQGRGLSYAVVSILGPQGSGKSTLLNHLFGTSFREMDTLKGRHQIISSLLSMAETRLMEACLSDYCRQQREILDGNRDMLVFVEE